MRVTERPLLHGLRVMRVIVGIGVGAVIEALRDMGNTVGRSTYYRWEACEEGPPPAVVRDLARIFKCSVVELEKGLKRK